MKTIMKTVLGTLVSLSMMFSVNAGDLGVSGSAKATYVIVNGANYDNGIGITNELNFTASGEMDNGYAWTYSMELDPDATDGSALNDDTQITLKLNDMGTIKVCVSECGNGKEYAFDQSAYVAMTDTGLDEGITYPASESSYANLQYHTPELPLGTTASIAYGQTPRTLGVSGNSKGGATTPGANTAGNSLEAYSVVTKPIDGLTVSAHYYSVKDYDDGVANEDQLEEGGSWGIVYAAGNLTAGYGKSYKAPEDTSATRTDGGTQVEYYENTGFSVAYAVNDELSVSYSNETGEASYQTSSTTAYDVEVDSIQAAYSLGGATLSIARGDYENMSYANGTDGSDTIIALSFAF
jgi:outer membrane protein OmpU